MIISLHTMPIGEPIEHSSYLERLQQDLLLTDDSEVEAIEIDALHPLLWKALLQVSVGPKSS